MARLCERPGCSAPAEVAYGFDAEQLTVWLDAFHTAQGARSGVLCRRHADAMVVPLGWMLDDRREPVPRLFRPPDEPNAEPARPSSDRPRRGRRSPADDTEQLRLVVPAALLDDEDETSPGTDDAESVVRGGSATDRTNGTPSSGDETAALPWQPQFDQTDDLQGLLKASSPLLSRAFTGLVPEER